MTPDTLDQLAEYTGTLADSRAALEPEIFAPVDPGDVPIGNGTAVSGETPAQRDVAMFELMRETKIRAKGIRDAYAKGKKVSFGGKDLTVDEAVQHATQAAKARLSAYGTDRAKAGGRVFQHLQDGMRQRESKRWKESLPFMAQLFSGPATMADQMPAADRAAFEDAFKHSLDPDRDKMAAANMRLVSEMTGKSIDEIAPAWTAIRSKYAQQAFGLSGVVDDATFYKAAGQTLSKEKADGDMLQKIHTRASTLALQGKPLAESLAEAKKIAGDRLPEFAAAVRQGHASVLAQFSDEEIKLADTMWNGFGRMSKDLETETGKESPDMQSALEEYGSLSQKKRENVLGIIALRAQDEGQDVKNYFARLAASHKSGVFGLVTGVFAGVEGSFQDRAQRMLDAGTIIEGVDVKDLVFGGGQDQLPDLSGVIGIESPKKRQLTAEEKSYLKSQVNFHKGARAFLTDLPGAGIKTKRYLQERAEGLDRFLNWSVMAAESLPLMAVAAVPYGGGLVLSATAYAEQNLSTLRRENPGMDNATMERTAYTSGLLMAGVDRLQINLMGAKLPKLQAWAFRQRKILAYPGVFGLRAAIAGAAETGQEVGQDLTLPALSQLASVLSDEIKGPNWKDVIAKEKEALGDIMGVSLIFGIIGGAGRGVADVISLPKLKDALTDREGLKLAGYSPETVEAVAKEAETNPLAAAETLKAAQMETAPEVRAANSKAALEAMKSDPPPSAKDAGLPEIVNNADGSVVLHYPDGTEDTANSMEDAFAALRVWEEQDSNVQEQGIRELLKFFEGYHEGNPELAVKGAYGAREVSFADWAKGSSERLAQAYARVRILMRDEFTAGRAETDGSELADLDIDLSQYLLLGSSKNTYSAGVTRIALQVAKAQDNTKRAGSTVLTPIEEHAEGIVKWLMDTGKKSEAWFIEQIREIEANTKAGQTMAGNIMEMPAEQRRQEVVEAFSRLAVANATGKVQDSQLSAGLKAVFRALKETIKAILELAADIARFRQSGKMDSEFAYWLDVAGGMQEDYFGENMVRQLEADMLAESMDGMPEIQSAIKGRLPHPETLKSNGHPLAGEVAALYDEIRQSEDSGANQSARTRKANEFFLPPGEMVDLDQVREALNEQGFDFATPAEMLDAAMLSVGYRKPQYGMSAGETFSIGRVKLTNPPYQETGSDLRKIILEDFGQEVGNAYTGWSIGLSTPGAAHIVAQNKGAGRVILPHLKNLVEQAVWMGRRDHREAGSPSGIRWQHLFYAPYERDGQTGVARFVVNETLSGERLIDAKAAKEVPVEFRAAVQPVKADSSISPAGKMTVRQLRDLVKSLWPDDPATLAPPVNDRRDREKSFSIVRADSPLIQAIDALVVPPEIKAKVFQKMAARVRDIRRRFERNRILKLTSEEETPDQRHEMLRDLATLEAVAKSLPPALRGKLISSFRAIDALKTSRGREDYMVRLLPKIEQALENHLQKQFREAIRRQMKKGAIKVSESRTRGGKIGAAGHAVFDQAKAAMKITDDPASMKDGKSAAQKAEELADRLREELESSPNLTDDQIAELDARISAVELFGDYGNANSGRLEEGLNLLHGTYQEGRREWLEVLSARRDLRAARVATVEAAMGRKGPVTDAERNAAAQRSRGLLTRLDEAVMQAGLSGSQKIRRLAELTEDPEIAALTEDMEMAFLEAENQESDANDADNQALAAAMRRIFRATTEYGVARKLRELTTVTGSAPVEKVEGRRTETVTVPVKYVEAILDGDLSALEAGGETFSEEVKAFDDQDRAQLEQAWEEFTDQADAEQSRKRTISFVRVLAEGERRTIGEVNQLEALQLYLTMRQPDQAVKLARLGYDETTLAQLEAWLTPEAKALGEWMVNHIGADAFTLDAIHRAEKGVGLKLVENYFPVRNDVSGSDNTGLSINGSQPQHTGKSIGAIKERVANNAPPAYVNALAVFLANRAQVNFWKAHVAPLREWGGVIRDERFASAVKVRMGETYYQSLTTLLKRIENGGALNAAKLLDWERLVKGLTRSFALGTLGGRVSTLAVNVAAALNVGLEIPAAELARGMADVLARPEAFKDAFNSPAIQRRLKQGASFEAQLSKASGPSRNPTLATLNSWAEKGVMPINWVDTGANVLGATVVWEYTRNQSLRVGMTEESARAAADKKVARMLLRAAQPTTRLAKSEMELKALENPLAALFTLFTSEPRKTLSILYLAARELTTGKGTYGKPMAAQQLFVALVVFQTADFMIRQTYAALAKADDDEPEDLLERLRKRIFDAKAWGYALTTTHLRAVPFGGEAWSWVWSKVFDQKAFIGSQNPLARATREVITFEKPETTEEAIDGAIDILQGVGPVIPGGAVFAQGGNAAEFVTGVATSSGVSFSDEDRAKRVSARYRAAAKALDEQLGKTTGADGKINKDIQKAKHAALADKLRAELAPMNEKVRSAVIKAKIAPDSVVKQAGFTPPD